MDTVIIKESKLNKLVVFIIIAFSVIPALIGSILLFMKGETDTAWILIFWIVFVVFVILIYFAFRVHWRIDSKQIIVRNNVSFINNIFWDDIERIELRYLCVRESKGREFKEAYVIFSKTKKQKDNHRYANERKGVLRLKKCDETDYLIAKYYQDNIVDARNKDLEKYIYNY